MGCAWVSTLHFRELPAPLSRQPHCSLKWDLDRPNPQHVLLHHSGQPADLDLRCHPRTSWLSSPDANFHEGDSPKLFQPSAHGAGARKRFERWQALLSSLNVLRLLDHASSTPPMHSYDVNLFCKKNHSLTPCLAISIFIQTISESVLSLGILSSWS